MARKNRRAFLKQSALAGAGFWASGGVSLAESKSANEKLNIAVIGAGGKGASDAQDVSGENIVALCDVDQRQAGKTFGKFPRATIYKDFRKMLEERKDIDAVVVSTPDHTHAPASVMAMKLGKHCFCQKPLTHSVYEARVMRQTAAEFKVATQMGNQGTSSAGLRTAVEVIQSGAIGPVREVHVWTNRPIWPQGITRPKDSPPVPATLDWDLWLGPAPFRPYSNAYVPFNWRGWFDFGTGALGDMACHTANMAFMALKLGAPTSIEAESSEVNSETYPRWSTIRYEFPARGDLPPVRFTWYDGAKPSPDNDKGERNLPPKELFLGLPFASGNALASTGKKKREKGKFDKFVFSGSLLVGEKGSLYSPDDYGRDYVLLPQANFSEFKPPEPFLPRSPGHHKEWIAACKGGPPALSNFDYAATLTEAILLGTVALRTGKKILWDADGMKAVGCPEADQFIRPEYRQGWTL